MNIQSFSEMAEVDAASLQTIEEGTWYTTTADPCPHCSNSSLALFVNPLGFKERRTQCLQCGASGPTGGSADTIKDMVIKWNWRPFPQSDGPIRLFPCRMDPRGTIWLCVEEGSARDVETGNPAGPSEPAYVPLTRFQLCLLLQEGARLLV